MQHALDGTREAFGSLDLVVNAIGARFRGRSFGGGGLIESDASALEPYVEELVPAIFNIARLGGRALVDGGGGTLVQITGGSARRAMGGRGPWAAGAFATRALLQSASLELRELGVHAALLIVDGSIESPKTAERLAGRDRTSRRRSRTSPRRCAISCRSRREAGRTSSRSRRGSTAGFP